MAALPDYLLDAHRSRLMGVGAHWIYVAGTANGTKVGVSSNPIDRGGGFGWRLAVYEVGPSAFDAEQIVHGLLEGHDTLAGEEFYNLAFDEACAIVEFVIEGMRGAGVLRPTRRHILPSRDSPALRAHA